jgi:hypothetical protein
VLIHTEKEGFKYGKNMMDKTELMEIIKKLLMKEYI